MLRSLIVSTATGTRLKGNIFKAPAAKTVVILITGVEGNIQNNPFYTVIGKKLAPLGIDLVVGHTRDAFNRVTMVNQLTRKQEVYGSFNEDFRDSDGDVDAYLEFAKNAGYQRIILGGQSLGANKVIHYLANHPQAPVDKFLLLSPVNVEILRRRISKSQRQVIKQWFTSGKYNKILPFRLFRWLSSTTVTAKRWLADDMLNNVHFGQDKDYTQLEKIKFTGAWMIGTYDRFTGGNPVKYLQNNNQHLPTAELNQIISIKNASHIYRHKEDELAMKISELVEKWQ
ncbi:alpha/beta hydrolase [Limosilactobacillus pontis]|uniref:Alpha/beta hydrolase n=1 Tax=Limosilactobacillus pontis TaxID=35787 RepID=A0A2J6NPH3_9LACO|nr:DUF1749 domain-containing protein [Limosilactobacillus pontis]PMB83209.1 alpha/beta hydrolase [Limosilactobacillus pontis]